MAYAAPLREPPRLPSAQAKIVNTDGTPSKEYATWMRLMQDFMERAYAALKELEP